LFLLELSSLSSQAGLFLLETLQFVITKLFDRICSTPTFLFSTLEHQLWLLQGCSLLVLPYMYPHTTNGTTYVSG
jgi:hypothetical protein